VAGLVVAWLPSPVLCCVVVGSGPCRLACYMGFCVTHTCVLCCLLSACLQHTPLIPMMTLVMAHGLSQDLFEKYKVIQLLAELTGWQAPAATSLLTAAASLTRTATAAGLTDTDASQPGAHRPLPCVLFLVTYPQHVMPQLSSFPRPAVTTATKSDVKPGETSTAASLLQPSSTAYAIHSAVGGQHTCACCLLSDSVFGQCYHSVSVCRCSVSCISCCYQWRSSQNSCTH
jgi:hypothetical protein